MRGFMKKAAERLCGLLKGILFVGFSVQIVLGLLWMCLNFIEIQQFGQPQGFLYPQLLKVLGKMPRVLFLLQLCLAGAADYVLLKPLLPLGKLWRIWFVAALMTFPMAMQCHLALLPYSFAGSWLILELCCCRRAINCKGGIEFKALAGAGGCWVMLALLLAEYSWLGLIPPAISVLVCLPRLCKNLRQLAYSVLLLAAFGGMVSGIGSITRSEGEYERTFWFSMASRMAWPTIWQDSGGWSQELKAILPPALCWKISSSSGNMERILQPKVEENVGREKAQEYYREMAENSWNYRKSRIARQIAGDVMVYAAPQAVLQSQLRGRGYDSYSGRNYEIMAMERPVLTKQYVGYSCWWFAVMLGITVLFYAAYIASGGKLSGKGKIAFPAVYAVSAGGILIYYVMRGSGMADYKCTLAVSAVWTVLPLCCLGKEQRDDSK